MNIWKLCAASLSLVSLLISAGAHAQENYPSKPIRMMVPWPAGNLTDGIGRKLSEEMSKVLQQPVWVENKGGASGQIGMEAISKATPDGYTIGISAIGPLAMNPALYSKLPYDSNLDFTPIAMLWSGPMVALVRSESPIKSVRDLVTSAASTPGGISYASPGNGTLQHITAELLRKHSGANLVHVPHKGTSQALTSVLGGHVSVIFETLSVALPHIKSGKLRVLAVSTAQRSPLLPEVPTLAESGFKDVVTDGWICLIGPKGMPASMQNKLNGEVRKILATQEFQSWAAGQGGTVVASSPEELGRHIQTEIRRLGDVIRGAKIQL